MIWNVLIPILLILAVVRWIITENHKKRQLEDADFPKKRNSQFKCAFCLYCKSLDEDGVVCKYGKTTTFKTPVHINNCIDFVRDS